MRNVPQMDDIINWIAADGMDGKELVPMYYKGQWLYDCEDGLRGDIKARPVELGPGEFTATYNPDWFEWPDGRKVQFRIKY